MNRDFDVRAALEPYAGVRAYLEPLAGNRGDDLILAGARHWLAPLAFEWLADPQDAELIVINGGGGLFAQPWCGDLSRLRKYTVGFPDTPIVVLPSSYFWGDNDFVACFTERSAPVVLFARELLSRERLEAESLPSCVTVAIDMDMAFRLADAPLIERARRVPCEGHLLLVERFDEEQSTGKPLRTKPLRKFARHLPRPAQDLAKRVLDKVRYRTSGFRHTVLEEALAIRPDLRGCPLIYKDVSNETRNTFEGFVQGVAAAKAVISTRMHAGILAALLDKPTFMKGKAGPYRKLQSVYAYSMADMPHVHLLE